MGSPSPPSPHFLESVQSNLNSRASHCIISNVQVLPISNHDPCNKKYKKIPFIFPDMRDMRITEGFQITWMRIVTRGPSASINVRLIYKTSVIVRKYTEYHPMYPHWLLEEIY